jgi:16S rRNA (cytosine967-C5)-methyltransferase
MSGISPATHNILGYEERLLQALFQAYGSRLEGVMQALGKPPKEYALRVNTLRTDVDRVILALQEMGAECRLSPLIEEAVLVKVNGPYQLERSGKIVVARKGAAESVMLGSRLYAPGVLKTEKYRVGEVVSVEDPKGHLVGKGIAMMPPKTDDLKRRGVAVDTKESIYRLPPLRDSELYGSGLIREQSIPAMIVSKVLEPGRGETIVDMCAAPGGKTLHIAQLIENEGEGLCL